MAWNCASTKCAGRITKTESVKRFPTKTKKKVPYSKYFKFRKWVNLLALISLNANCFLHNFFYRSLSDYYFFSCWCSSIDLYTYLYTHIHVYVLISTCFLCFLLDFVVVHSNCDTEYGRRCTITQLQRRIDDKIKMRQKVLTNRKKKHEVKKKKSQHQWKIMERQKKMQWLLNHLSHNWKKIILLRLKWTIECARLDTFNQTVVIGLQW